MRITRQQVKEMICHEDESVIVVHKPAFLAVETKNLRQQDLVSLLKNYRVSNGETAEIYLVHRLDQPVEGLMVVAKTKQAAATLSKEMCDGDFAKEYVAVVQGVTPERESLKHDLIRDGHTNRSRIATETEKMENSEVKEARLKYVRLASTEKYSLLRIALDTGRHHQIRVQMSAIGHPLCGDVKYGSAACGAEANETEANNGSPQPLALCSYRLCFTHPKRAERMEFQTKPTGSFFEMFATYLNQI